MERTAHVGADVDAAAVLQVAERLLKEGRSRLDSSPESALVALQQAFSLEQQFGTDGERLCRACASVCHALSRIAHPQPPVAAVEPLVQALETLDKMRSQRDAGAAVVVLDEHAEFLARELLGLARQLARLGCGVTTSATTLAEVARPSSLLSPRTAARTVHFRTLLARGEVAQCPVAMRRGPPARTCIPI